MVLVAMTNRERRPYWMSWADLAEQLEAENEGLRADNEELAKRHVELGQAVAELKKQFVAVIADVGGKVEEKKYARQLVEERWPDAKVDFEAIDAGRTSRIDRR